MTMENKTCCVTGNREIPADKLDYVRRELEREIEEALEDGYRTFLTGFAEGVDMLFARCVNERRREYPDIFIEAAIPYVGRIKRFNEEARALFAKCDGFKIICAKYERDCFFRRNRYMVQYSSRVIAVYDGRADGGTLYTMEYARTMERVLRIIEIE